MQRPCGSFCSILGLYCPLVAPLKQTWPGPSSSNVKGCCLWWLEPLSGTPRCQLGYGEEGTKRTINAEGKGTSGNPFGKKVLASPPRTKEHSSRTKKCTRPKESLHFTDEKLRPKDSDVLRVLGVATDYLPPQVTLLFPG